MHQWLYEPGVVIRTLFLTSIVVLLAIPGSAESQNLDRIRELSIDSIRGPVQTYYSEGLRDEALSFARLVADLDAVVSDSLGLSIHPILAVLNHDDWGVFPVPPGLPETALTPRVEEEAPGVYFVGIPVPSPPLENSYRAAGAFLPESRGTQLRRAGLEYSDAVASSTAAILYHELGHAYALELGIGTDPRWFAEFIASYVGYSGLVQVSDEHALVWDAIMDARASAPPPSPSTLEGFMDWLGTEEVLWYQGRFAQLIRELQPTLGFQFVRDVQGLYNRTGGLGQATILPELERLAPRFREWADSLGR